MHTSPVQFFVAINTWVKGKVERPYTFIREGFWRGYGYIDTAGANRDLAAWIAKKDERIHGTTHEQVNVRFERERPYLTSLPHQEFDTSYRAYRKVYKDCTIRFEGNSYVLPHTLVGEQVILRFKTDQLRIYKDDQLIVVYRIPDGKGKLIQDKRFYDDLKKDRELNRRKYRSGRREKGRAKMTISPKSPKYELEVEIRSILDYEALKACQSGMSIYFTNMEDLILKLNKDHEAGKPGKGRSYYKSSLVVVDEVGYTPITREECNLFFRFIANRYEKSSTIITSNKAFSDWTELFHDPIIVTAILDRFLHHSAVINIKGSSYRLKEKIQLKEDQ